MRSKALLILVLLTVAVAVAAMLAQRDTGEVAGAGEPLLPGLLERVNEVTTVTGIGAGETVTLERDGNRWVVPEKHRYPADQDKVRELILGAARLTRIEPKTSNPDLYSRIGLDDIHSTDGTAVQYSFKNANGDALAELIVGNSRLGRADPQTSEYFVREPAMAQSWLVQGKLPDTIGVIAWLDSEVVGVAQDRVHQVKVTHPDGAVVKVGKKKPSQRTFDLLDVPEGTEIDSKWKLGDLGRSLAGLDLDDVMPASQASVPEDGRKVEMTTFDGLRITLRSVKEGDRTLARLEASFDESAVVPEFMPGGEKSEGESTLLLTADAVQDEVKRFNREWKNWVYVIPKYRADYMSVRKEDLIKAGDKKDES